MRQTFLLGQVNIILALMVVADMTLDLPLPRGILVGLAAAIKVTPIILIPYLFLTRQGRAGVRATATFCAAALLAAAFNSSTSWAYWTHYIRDPQRAGMLSWIGNQGVLGALERMIGHTVSTPTTFVIVLTVGVRRPRGGRRGLPPLVAGPRPAGRGGDRVAGQPGVVVAPLHLGGAPGRLAGAGAGPAALRRVARPGRRRALLGRAALVGAARAGVHLRRPGLAACPSRTAYVLLFIALVVGAGVRVVRGADLERPHASGRPAARWRRRAPAPEPG